MKQNLPPLTQDLIDAFAASAVLWLVRLLGLLVSPRAWRRRRMLHRLMCYAERWVEHILFITAGHRLRALVTPRKPTTRKPTMRIFVRPGFRISTGDNRLLWKSARIRLRNASLVDRAARLLEALANPERYVRYYMKRLAKGLCFRRLIPCAPPASALHSFDVCEPTFADSS